MNLLLDTNVISELIAPKPNLAILNWLDAQDADQVCLSVLTIGEICKCIEKLPESKRKQSLWDWLNNDLPTRFSNRILTINASVMMTWGILVAQQERIGRPLPALYSLIVASALHYRCQLVTRNEKDFDGTGIIVVNPWKQA